ncbi:MULTISPECIES: hypothetical protein [Bradyrhizobium]|jgi:hypothetical protein|uniref:Uncharacterized protein n=2 Tax=Bradyrhizobium TaxID=374 RepID=A0ABY0PZW1_9BRAD|nr:MULTISPECIES: hypothetical protein [Bradyrhizobium]SDJ24115.1 hypothetical protein SAMN05444163_4924 [Bradyrhizobium ottawaense]SEC77870.1 hypothetical protein SAMN05444171_2239 [Bradyrhizobium lablabi]SHK89580.1 hypothetical protein SAMN05444321_1063 [Bradyrhizobium lablabi]
MTDKPSPEFGKRRPVGTPLITPAPVKRSGHVALLLMGTLAVGGGAYALMPSESCQQTPPGMAASTECQPRGSSSGGHSGSGGGSSRSNFFSSSSSSGDSSSSHAGSGASESGSGGVQRGGFGSFAHAFAGHFSGGG